MRKRVRLITVVIIAITMVVCALLLVNNLDEEIAGLENDLKKSEVALRVAQQEIGEINTEISNMDKASYIIARARELGYLMPGEIRFVVVNPDQLAAGNYGKVDFAYINQRDAFLYDPVYAQFVNSNSPLGTAGSFHIVAFDTANLKVHTNGNILAKNLNASANFGTNSKGEVNLIELHYIQNYLTVNGGSSADMEDYLVLGDSNTITTADNNTALAVNETKLNTPGNVLQDENTQSAPFIDLARVENEIKTISANLASYPTITEIKEMTYNIDPAKGDTYIQIMDPDNIGVVNMTAAQVDAIKKANKELKMQGFETGGSGAIIVNVDCKDWPADVELWLPDAYVYVDGDKQNTSETVDFSAGKVIWNMVNADHISIHTQHMTGMVVAPESDVFLEYSFNGTVIGDNVENHTESHRTDFVGKIYLNEFREGAHIHVYKVDKGNYGKYLAGAHFALYQWDSTLGKYVTADLGTDEHGTAYPNTAVSDSSGIAFFDGLRYNVAYMVVETKAPDDYIRDKDAIYMYYEHADTETYPVSKPDDFKGSTLTDDCYIHHVPNVPSEVPTTSLTMQKIWQDAAGNPLPIEPDSVTFEVWRSEQAYVEGENGAVSLAEAENDKLYAKYTVTKEDNWNLTVDGLPKTDGEMTVQYTYYVKEVTVDGCSSTTYAYNEDHTSVTITNRMDVVYEYDVMVLSKDWFDVPVMTLAEEEPVAPELSPEAIPVDEITVTIYQVSGKSADGPWGDSVEFKTVTVKKSDNWSWKSAEKEFPKSVTVGNQKYYFAYYADEKLVEGFAPGGDIDADNAVVIPQELELENTRIGTTDLLISKVWKDQTGKVLENFNHEPITVHVYIEENGVKQDKPAYTVPVSADNRWTASLKELPLTDPYGEIAYTYVVEEVPVPGYADTYVMEVQDGALHAIITNREASYTDLTVNKVWVNSAGAETDPPADLTQITANVYRHVDGVKEADVFETLTIRAEDQWTATMEDLLANDGTHQYTYTVEEVAIPGYEVSYSTEDTAVTITNKELGEKTSITVNKQWFRGNVDVTAFQNTPVQFYLYQLSDQVSDSSQPITINVDLTQADHKNQLTGYVGDTLTIKMTWKRQKQDDWVPNVGAYDRIYINSWADDNFIPCTNKIVSEDENTVFLTYQLTLTDAIVSKHGTSFSIYSGLGFEKQYWSDVGSSISVAEAEPYSGPYTLDPGNGWMQTIRNLPRVEIADDGTEITYSYYVKEVNGEQYDVSYVNNDTANGIESGTITIQNRTDDDKTSVTVEKKWLDADGNVIENAAGEIRFKLYQVGTDGTSAVYPNEDSIHTLSQAQNGWNLTFSDLPLMNEDGTVTYSYYAEELDPGSYTVTYTTLDGTAVGAQTPVSGGTIVITNQVTKDSFQLPETGGVGTTPYTMAGIAMLCSGAYLLYIREKRRRGVKA